MVLGLVLVGFVLAVLLGTGHKIYESSKPLGSKEEPMALHSTHERYQLEKELLSEDFFNAFVKGEGCPCLGCKKNRQRDKWLEYIDSERDHRYTLHEEKEWVSSWDGVMCRHIDYKEVVKSKPQPPRGPSSVGRPRLSS